MMRCAAYARFSSDLQRATSIEDQVRVAREYAAAQGWSLLEDRVYSDAGISGASIEGRPGLQALMTAVAQQPRPFDALLVDDSSRVARDLADAMRFLQTLKFFGVRIIYISQAIDSASEQAETLIAVHGLVDGLYLREARAKIRRGLIGQHARGFATGGLHFGYRMIDVLDPSGKAGPDGHTVRLGRRIEIHPVEADTVRRIFDLYGTQHLGIEAIVSALNREGRRAAHGRRWRAGAIRTVLKREKYRGLTIWGQRTATMRPGTNQRIMRPQPRDQWQIQERPDLRIISDEQWDRAQARAAEVRAAFGLRHGSTLVRGKNAALYSRHLFSGFLRCAECQGAITCVSGGKGSPRYGCQRSWKNGIDACANRLTIRAKIADAALLAGLQGELLKPETVRYLADALAAELNRAIDQRPKQRTAAEAALRDAKRRLEHLIEAVETGATATPLLDAMHKRQADIRRLESELDALSEPINDKMAVMPAWVRQQLEDAAGLLAESPERTKAEFRRLGLLFVVTPVRDEGSRPFLRAVGTTDLAHIISGQYLQGSTTDMTHLRSAP